MLKNKSFKFLYFCYVGASLLKNSLMIGAISKKLSFREGKKCGTKGLYICVVLKN